MSLINDALKRAIQTQPDAAASADGPALRPHFAQGRSQGGNDWLMPVLIVAVLLLGTALIWQWFRSGAAITVRAKTAPEIVAPASAPEPVTASVPPVSMLTPVAAKLANVDSTAQTSTDATAAAPVSGVTNAPVVAPVAPAPPPPPAYKLQSIFYRAKSPAAVINGKTLFVGDRVASAHVTAIDKDSVTIVTTSGETKVLELP